MPGPILHKNLVWVLPDGSVKSEVKDNSWESFYVHLAILQVQPWT